jgi:O-antigen ligase
MGLTVFWALDPSASVVRLVTYAELILLMVVVSVMPVSPIDYTVVIWSAVGGAFLSSLYGIYLYHTGAQEFQIGGRLAIKLVAGAGQSTLDPNSFAGALLLPVAIVGVGVLGRKWSLRKIGLIIVLGVLFGALIVSQSRGAWLAVATMICYLVLRSRYKLQLIAFSLVGLLGSFFMPHSPWSRFSNAISGGGSGRLTIWKVGWSAFKHHAWIGAGVGMFPAAYDQELIKVLQPEFGQWGRAAHNSLLLTGVELGIVGLLILFAAYWALWITLGNIRRSIPVDLSLSLESALVGLTVASMFLALLDNKYPFLLLMVIFMARSLALCHVAPTIPQNNRPPIPIRLKSIHATLSRTT